MLKLFMMIVGVLCLAAALAANPWSLRPLLGLNAPLPVALGIVTGIVDLTLAGLGVLLIKNRNNRGRQLSLLIASVTMAVCSLSVEVFLRLADFQPGVLRLYRPVPGPSGSFRIKPNLNIVTRIDNSTISIRTNAYGMRWRDVDLRKPSGATRVAFVGDSFAFGQWSDSAEHSLVGVFDTQMKPLGVDVLNFGVPGFGFLDIEDQLETDIKPFQPDYIALLSFNGNDFLDTYVPNRYEVLSNGKLGRNQGRIAEKIPAEFLKKQWNAGVADVLERIYLYNLVQYVAKGIFLTPEAGFPPSRPPFETASSVSNIFWNRKEYPPFAAEARDVSIKSLERIWSFCQANGAELIIFTIPTLQQIYFTDAFPEGYDVRRPQKYLEEFAVAHAIPYKDLLPPLAEHVRRTGANLHFQQEGHFNNEGHRVTGRLVAEFFNEVVATVQQ